jgi:hypothetical protein
MKLFCFFRAKVADRGAVNQLKENVANLDLAMEFLARSDLEENIPG